MESKTSVSDQRLAGVTGHLPQRPARSGWRAFRDSFKGLSRSALRTAGTNPAWGTCLGSSMDERGTSNPEDAGSSPAQGARGCRFDAGPVCQTCEARRWGYRTGNQRGDDAGRTTAPGGERSRRRGNAHDSDRPGRPSLAGLLGGGMTSRALYRETEIAHGALWRRVECS